MNPSTGSEPALSAAEGTSLAASSGWPEREQEGAELLNDSLPAVRHGEGHPSAHRQAEAVKSLMCSSM